MYLQTIIIFKEVLGLENLFLYSSIPFCLSNKYRGEKKKGIEVFLALRLDMLYELFDLRETVCDTETWKFDTLVEHLLVGNKLSPVGKCKSYTNFIPPYFILPHCFFSQTIQCFQLLLGLISFQYTRFKANMVYTLTAHIFSKESCMSAGVRSIRKHCIPISCLNDDAQ